jgi:hypothetical protein
MNNDSTENGSAFLGFNRGAIGKGFEADDEWRVHGIVWECLCNDNLISTSAGTKEILPTVLQCRSTNSSTTYASTSRVPTPVWTPATTVFRL